ncbi:MAG: hypothetical protein ACE5JR_06280 [Gemmatimonadota bacterium]
MPKRRYCSECDVASGDPTPAASQAPSAAAARTGRAELRLFLAVFLLAGFSATLLGVGAPSALSLPSLRQTLGLGRPADAAERWGEIRYIHSSTRIRADRTTESAMVGGLQPGDSVRVDFAQAGWYAIFRADETVRDVQRALGYVYAPLLKQTRPATNRRAAR